MDKGVDFGAGSVRRSILRIALPMTLAQLINVLYNVVDRVYIGHIPGAACFTAMVLDLRKIMGKEPAES